MSTSSRNIDRESKEAIDRFVSAIKTKSHVDIIASYSNEISFATKGQFLNEVSKCIEGLADDQLIEVFIALSSIADFHEVMQILEQKIFYILGGLDRGSFLSVHHAAVKCLSKSNHRVILTSFHQVICVHPI